MDIWKHGKYLDLWSVVHVLTGVVLAQGAYGLGLSFWTAFFIAAFLIVGWEVYELIVKIIEHPANVISDIVTGLGGFLFAAYVHYGLESPFDLRVFSALLVATLLLALWGFINFLRYGYR